jgi:hypothetical protein
MNVGFPGYQKGLQNISDSERNKIQNGSKAGNKEKIWNG